MRRLVLGIVVFVVIGIVLSLVFREHQGYVLISFNGWQIETSLLFAVAGVLLGVWLLALAWQIVVAVLFAPRTIRRLRNRRRLKKARHSWHSGLLHLAEARWSSAESELEALAEGNESPGLNHLFAARAAHYQDHVADRDRYLKKASADRSVSELAVLMTQAELQIAAGQAEDAGATLARLHELEPRHPWVLRLYAAHALAQNDYRTLFQLLPEIRRADVLSEPRLAAATESAVRYQLSQPDNVGALTSSWRDVPKDLRREPTIAGHYAARLAELGENDEAANVIRHRLKKDYDDTLARIYAALDLRDRTAQLADVAHWIDQHGRQPVLLLAAGQLCLDRELWDRARDYLDAQELTRLEPSDQLVLGRLHERLAAGDSARMTYRRGLERALLAE